MPGLLSRKGLIIHLIWHLCRVFTFFDHLLTFHLWLRSRRCVLIESFVSGNEKNPQFCRERGNFSPTCRGYDPSALADPPNSKLPPVHAIIRYNPRGMNDLFEEEFSEWCLTVLWLRRVFVTECWLAWQSTCWHNVTNHFAGLPLANRMQ